VRGATTRRWVAGTALLAVRLAPQLRVVDDAVGGHERSRLGHQLADLATTVGAVVDVAAVGHLAVRHVVGGVQDELVPGHVHDVGRAVAAARVVGDGVDVAQHVVDGSVGRHRVHAVLVHESPHELTTKVVVDGDDVGVHWIAPFMV